MSNCCYVDHCDGDDIKKAYSLAMKQGFDQSRNFQLFIVGAENTGKTNLIYSLLGEDFLEEQLATKGVDVEVCEVDYEDWNRINNSEVSSILYNQFSYQCKGTILRKMANFSTPSSPKASSHTSLAKKPSITHSDVLFTTVPLTPSMITASHSNTYGNSFTPRPQYMPKASSKALQLASLWDFAGQVIFHNSHSVFISDNGVIVIAFNASMKLTDNIIPRENFPQLPACCTIISSIHYWLQVVNSVCSVKENVLLVGTHIDKLHPDIEVARKVASETILSVLIQELCGKPYAQHLAGISGGLKNALRQSCFFVSNKYRDEEIVKLKTAAVKFAALLQKEKPIFFLKLSRHCYNLISRLYQYLRCLI